MTSTLSGYQQFCNTIHDDCETDKITQKLLNHSFYKFEQEQTPVHDDVTTFSAAQHRLFLCVCVSWHLYCCSTSIALNWSRQWGSFLRRSRREALAAENPRENWRWQKIRSAQTSRLELDSSPNGSRSLWIEPRRRWATEIIFVKLHRA